jgi:hypothetical protein
MAECLDIVILESGATTHAVAFARRGGDIAITTLPCDGRLTSLEAFRDKIKNALKIRTAVPAAMNWRNTDRISISIASTFPCER